MKLKKKHFELYKKECEYWMNIFQLNNWEYVFEFKNLNNIDSSSTINGLDHNVTFGINTEQNTSFDRNMSFDNYIKQLAKHEVIHVLLGRLAYLADKRYVNEDELREAEEELVRKLIKIV